MANRSAAKGLRFERRVRDDLSERGFFCMRSPASKSTVDIVAVKRDEVLFVQCKTNGRLDPGPWNALYQLAIEHGGTPILASKPARGVIAYQRLIDAKRDRRPGCDLLDEWRP